MSDLYGNITVIGTTGSGKSTLARRLAAKTGRTRLDLDDFFWRPGWHAVTPEEFRHSIAAAIAAAPGQWVAAGSYSKVRDVIWPHTQTLVALDYSPPRIFWQLLRRTFKRCWSQEPICNGNTETWGKSFLSRDSTLIWFFQTFRRRQRDIRAVIDNPAPYTHLRILRFTHPKETEQWLTTL